MFARPPHQVSSLTFRISSLPAPSLSRVSRISSFGFRISPDLSGVLCETNPISSRSHPEKCKTNPISPATDLCRTKKCKTNPIHHPLVPPITRNEPNKDNARSNRAASIFNPHGSGGYANEPNLSPAIRKKRKTNPISSRPTPKMRNKPNFIPPLSFPRRRESRIYQLRTTNYGLLLQNKPNPSTAHDPNAQNEPNLPPIPHKHLYTKSSVSSVGSVASQRNAKQTQFTTPYTIRNIQYTIPWPNSRHAALTTEAKC